jgi:hypothetical protein
LAVVREEFVDIAAHQSTSALRAAVWRLGRPGALAGPAGSEGNIVVHVIEAGR